MGGTIRLKTLPLKRCTLAPSWVKRQYELVREDPYMFDEIVSCGLIIKKFRVNKNQIRQFRG